VLDGAWPLAYQGGEKCALRCDLRTPFARWLVEHGVQSAKRYQVAKVYIPEMNGVKEVFMCDFNVAGSHDQMLADAEVLRITMEVLDGLKMGAYEIKVNHRGIVDGVFEVCGVPEGTARRVAGAVNKIDEVWVCGEYTCIICSWQLILRTDSVDGVSLIVLAYRLPGMRYIAR
jgi:histidyl-tRNA synthetase